MNQQAAPAGQSAVTMDKLETLVQKAAHAIDTLQAENARLKAELKRHEISAATASAQLDEQAARIAALEQAEAPLKEDAAWCRWFRNKYMGSTFYHHVQTAYQQDCPPAVADAVAAAVVATVAAESEPKQETVAA